MPRRPPSPCTAPGGRCPNLVDGGGRCAEHRKQGQREYNAQRSADPDRTDAYYKTPAWRRLRLLVLHRDPICRMCERAESTTADHKTPRRQGGADSLENLQGLCGGCHSMKTAGEANRWGREPTG